MAKSAHCSLENVEVVDGRSIVLSREDIEFCSTGKVKRYYMQLLKRTDQQAMWTFWAGDSKNDDPVAETTKDFYELEKATAEFDKKFLA